MPCSLGAWQCTIPFLPSTDAASTTVPLFAGELGVSERTIWRLIAAQKIKTIKISMPPGTLELISTR